MWKKLREKMKRLWRWIKEKAQRAEREARERPSVARVVKDVVKSPHVSARVRKFVLVVWDVLTGRKEPMAVVRLLWNEWVNPWVQNLLGERTRAVTA